MKNDIWKIVESMDISLLIYTEHFSGPPSPSQKDSTAVNTYSSMDSNNRSRSVSRLPVAHYQILECVEVLVESNVLDWGREI
jgi:hypothetical protein